MTDILSPKKRSAFNRALKHEELLPLLFRKVNELYWFDVFEEEGLLAPEGIPLPIHDEDEGTYQIPSWSIAEYLVSSSITLRDAANHDYAVRYLDLLRACTKYAIDNEFSNYRVWWQFAKILKNIPEELLNEDDILVLEYWMSDEFERGLIGDIIGSWLLDLLETNTEHANYIASVVLRSIFRIEYIDKKTGNYERIEPVLLFHSYKIDELSKELSYKAGYKLGKDIVNYFKSNLENILYRLDFDNWSSVKRAAIEDHEQNHFHDDADDIIINCLRESLLGYIDGFTNEAEKYLRSLFDSDHKTVKRIAIYAADAKFSELNSDTVTLALSPEYFNRIYRHEMWCLLNQHFNEFSEEQKNNIHSIIDAIIEYDDANNISEDYTAYQKLIWLSAIKEHDDTAATQYSSYLEITKTEPDHPEFSSYSSTGWVVHKSPIELDELRLLSYEDLVETLNTYQSSGGFREPGIEGLTKTFLELVKTDAPDIYKHLGSFSELSTPYAYSLLSAFSELWKESKSTNLEWDKVWTSLLDYIHNYIQRDKFWEEPDNRTDGAFVANKFWTVGIIGTLLESGCQSDQHSFDIEHIDKTKEILDVLLSKVPGEEFSIKSDAVSVAINSPRGKCLEAIINLALFTCRHEDEIGFTKDEIWLTYQPFFDEELSRADTKNEYEFATLITQYLHNFLYLSETWTINNLPTIFDQNNYLRWLCAVQGYSYVNRLYPAIYDYLAKNGDLIKILDDENLKDRVGDRYIQFITLEYLYGTEDLDLKNSQISILLERSILEELSQIIWFIWTLRRDNDEKLQTKVYIIWSKMMQALDTETKDGKKLASKLCHFAVFIDILNAEQREWLLTIAPYSEVEHNSHDLLEVIARLSHDYPFEMHDVWLEMLTQYSYPYPEEAIKDAFNNLVIKGNKGVIAAKEVATAYLKHGFDQPREWLTEIIEAARGKI